MIEKFSTYSKQLNEYLSTPKGLNNWDKKTFLKNYKHNYDYILPEGCVINSHGFRGEEFKKDTDLIFAGCSQTYGYGLKEESMWGVMLSKENNMSYANISIPGASPMHIVFNIFKYFEKYGHPKVIVALFPDFYRIRTFLDSKILNRRSQEIAKKNQKNIFVDSHGNNGLGFLKYLKLPTSPEKVYSQEFTYMINSMFITMLETYCNKNNIIFIWSKTFNYEKYDDYQDSFLSFKNYYSFDLRKEIVGDGKSSPLKYGNYSCHENNNKNDPCWDAALDNLHFGTHINIHIKDFFQKILKEKIHYR